MADIQIFTDGSCLKNPDGPGGWASVITYNSKVLRKVSGKAPNTTNNIMELTALLEAMRSAVFMSGKYKDKNGNPLDRKIIIYSDSKYSISCFTDWGFNWMLNDWKKKTGGEIKNLDLIKQGVLIYQNNKSILDIRWVKAHTGGTDFKSLMNEQADLLAKEQAEKAKCML